MLELLLSVLAAVRVFFRTRAEASLEMLALRQQLAVLKRQTTAADIDQARPLDLDDPPARVAPMGRRAGSL